MWDPIAPLSSKVEDPDCVKDEFSRDVLRRFDTPEKLLGEDLRATLSAFGSLLRTETSRIECRHAAVRRLMRAKGGSTHAAEFSAISADWLLMRARKLERDHWAKRKPQSQPKRDRPARGRPKRKQGGGPQRAFLSVALRGARFPDADSRRRTFLEAGARYRAVVAQGGADLERLRAAGRAGTISRRHGRPAFGVPLGKRRRYSQDIHGQWGPSVYYWVE